MKLLYISINYQPNDFYEEFKKHFEVSLYQGVDHAIRFNPDHIHIHAGAVSWVELSEIASRTKAKITQFTGDIGLEPLPSITKLIDFCDTTFLTGINHPYKGKIEWMPEAITESYVNPIREDVSKITFIGNYYDHFPEAKTRIEMSKMLAKEFPNDFRLYGAFPEGTNCQGQTAYENTSKLYNESYFSIACDNFLCPDYFTQRYVGIMANTLCLGRWFPGIEKFFTHMENIVIWNDVDNLYHWVNYFKDRPSERLRIAKNGQELVKNNYLYSHWVERFKALI